MGAIAEHRPCKSLRSRQTDRDARLRSLATVNGVTLPLAPSKNRHGRFRDCDLLRELLETTVPWLKGLSVATASRLTPA